VRAGGAATTAGLGHVVETLRPTRAIIDLGALANHVRVLSAALGGPSLMAVVKANGYGHGATMVARTALLHGASALAVATVDEGAALRADGITADILVLGPVLSGEVTRALENRLQLTVISPSMVLTVSASARRLGLTCRPQLHVKLDSGMHRFGSDIETAIATARQIDADGHLKLAGVCTHLASAEEDALGPTIQQMSCFEAFLGALAAAGIQSGTRHVANSAATLRFSQMHLDMVRVGLAMYGLNPSPNCSLPGTFRPVLRVVSRIGRIHPLLPGDRVGYGGSFVATKPMFAALIPIGYADGYRRSLSSAAWMSIGGERAPVLGRVSMDQTVVGLTPQKVAHIDVHVAVFGDGSAGEPTIDDIALLAGTNSYEIICGLGARVPRVYVEGEEVVGFLRPGHGYVMSQPAR